MPAIGAPGRAAVELGPGLPPVAVSAPDHVLTEYAAAGVEIRAASVRGLMHRYRGQPRQDSFSIVHDPDTATTVVVVCDGVGSLPRSHEAAEFVTQRLPSLYLAQRDLLAAARAVNEDLWPLAVDVPLVWPPPAPGPGTPSPAEHDAGSEADAVNEAAPDGGTAGQAPQDTTLTMATTLVAVALRPSPEGWQVTMVWTGDSLVWHLSADHRWTPAMTLPQAQEGAVHTGAVRALPTRSPRLHHASFSFGEGALFVMTDGVGLPLENSSQVQETLAAWWRRPPDIFDFARQVSFARKTHVDDRTVVGLWASQSPASRQGGGHEDGGHA